MHVTPAQKVNQMKIDWGGKPYTQDEYPSNLTDDELRVVRQRYKHLPERFYTKTGLQVVTP